MEKEIVKFRKLAMPEEQQESEDSYPHFADKKSYEMAHWRQELTTNVLNQLP